MYRIQAFNQRTQSFHVIWADTMEERDATVRRLIASGDYHPASISFEWLARKGY